MTAPIAEPSVEQQIVAIAADMEVHARAIGNDHLARGEDIPTWVLDDIWLALVLQGELDF